MRGVHLTLASSDDGFTYAQLAKATFETAAPTRSQVVAVRRAVRRLVEEGQAMKISSFQYGREKIIIRTPAPDPHLRQRIRDLLAAPRHTMGFQMAEQIFGTYSASARQLAAITLAVKEL